MGTLYIDRKDLYLKLDGEAIAFYSKREREGSVPMNPLKRVVMVGNIVVESSVLNKLSQKGISVLFLSGKRLRFCGILHGRLHNNGILRVKQYEKSLSEDFVLQIAVEIVKRKILGQKELLIDIKESRPELRFALTKAICTLQGILNDIERENINIDTLRGLEGGASSAYFSAFTQAFAGSLGFRGRNKRPPEDPVNAMLSLCYTLVHFEFVREIEVAGLDPVIGFYHQFDYGRESLACDLVESYRPEVDRFVWLLFKERRFTGRDFTMDDERPGCYLKKGGRQKFYPIYEEWAKERRKLWTDEVRSIARRILDGKESLY
jgi:CRISPR-associated protein Cas1